MQSVNIAAPAYCSLSCTIPELLYVTSLGKELMKGDILKQSGVKVSRHAGQDRSVVTGT